VSFHMVQSMRVVPQREREIYIIRIVINMIFDGCPCQATCG